MTTINVNGVDIDLSTIDDHVLVEEMENRDYKVLEYYELTPIEDYDDHYLIDELEDRGFSVTEKEDYSSIFRAAYLLRQMGDVDGYLKLMDNLVQDKIGRIITRT